MIPYRGHVSSLGWITSMILHLNKDLSRFSIKENVVVWCPQKQTHRTAYNLGRWHSLETNVRGIPCHILLLRQANMRGSCGSLTLKCTGHTQGSRTQTRLDWTVVLLAQKMQIQALSQATHSSF